MSAFYGRTKAGVPITDPRWAEIEREIQAGWPRERKAARRVPAPIPERPPRRPRKPPQPSGIPRWPERRARYLAEKGEAET